MHIKNIYDLFCHELCGRGGGVQTGEARALAARPLPLQETDRKRHIVWGMSVCSMYKHMYT